jgi:hypothetical protein
MTKKKKNPLQNASFLFFKLRFINLIIERFLLANGYANSCPPENILTRCLVAAPCAACLIYCLVAKFSYILLVMTQRVPLIESNILLDKWVVYVL